MLKRHLQNLAALAFGLVLLGGAAEGLLRLLPVNSGLNAQEVSPENPVMRYLPDRNFVYSKGPLLEMVNRGRVNNEGFVNDQDYVKDAQRPLIAVIGDSFVEALMVPFPSTLAGRLAKEFAGKGSVYSFSASGAPLSQYLVWAEHAKNSYRPNAMVFVIVGNDFDESLLAYKQAHGFHYFKMDENQELTLTRIDYAPSGMRKFLRRSALIRYLVLNFNIEGLMADPAAWMGNKNQDMKYAGNATAEADSARLTGSSLAVREFLARLPAASGLPPNRILFLVDGFRYPALAEKLQHSYFAKMRQYFLSEATNLGFEAIDMDLAFIPDSGRTSSRFEFPNDGHWNSLAHRLAAEEALKSRVFTAVQK